jgi:hypothetical protein
MRHSFFVRSLIAGALFAGGTAHAGTDFFGRTVGSFVFTDAEPPIITGSLDGFFIVLEGAPFQSLTMTFEITRHDQGPDDMVGMFTFIGADPGDTLSGTYEGINFPNKDGVWTGAGSWTADVGSGAFSDLSGEGTWTTALFIDDGSAATTFNGVIVPAPGAGAAVVVGLLMTARRRRSRPV